MEQNKIYMTRYYNALFKLFMLNVFVTALIVGFHNSYCLADQSGPENFHCLTRFDHGTVNWTTGNIQAIGKASVEDNTKTSHRSVPGSARADANRHIIDILKQLIINNSLSVGEYASKNDVILAGLEKTARDAVIKKQYYTSALAVEIRIETNMFGGFLQLVLPEQIKQIPQIHFEKSGEKEKSRKPGENLYTGLIIDARKLAVDPVLNPVITSEQGHDIYSSTFISREFAVQNGVCKYFCNMEEALKYDRIGSHPLVLKGLRSAGEQNRAIVISMSDYSLLEKTTERHTFLKECRLIIVKD